MRPRHPATAVRERRFSWPGGYKERLHRRQVCLSASGRCQLPARSCWGVNTPARRVIGTRSPSFQNGRSVTIEATQGRLVISVFSASPTRTTRMNARLLSVAAVGLLLAGTRSVCAEVSDLANLAPARTLAYLELHDPPALARELHALIKGSYLQRPALFLANHMKQGKKVNEEALLLAWLGSPEFIDELGDWQGGFVALTGLTRNDEPEVVGVLRTGRSRMFPLAVRMILLESGPIHCIARVEG